MKRSRSHSLWLVLVYLSVFGSSRLEADLATIYLKNGQARTVELVAVDRGQVQWRASTSATEVQSSLRSQIDYVAFPTTGVWREAVDAFESGDLPTAITRFQLVIADPVSHYFPIPGNYVSLAREYLLRCFRLQMDAARIAEQAQIVREEFLNLPPDLRKVDPAVAAWSALAAKDWGRVLEILETVERPGPEVFYLRGRALEATGEREEAIREYAGAYVLNFGGSVALTQEALRRSSTLLGELGDSDRKAELQAQVKLYRDLYGGGGLWEGASEELVKLADAKIEAFGSADGEMEKPSSSMDSEGGTVVGETATVATTVPLEERDFILVDEIEERAFLVGYVSETSQPKLNAVSEKEYGYEFGETGGGILIGAFSGKTPVYEIRAKFNSAKDDGIIFDMNDRAAGGMGLYLKEGTLLFAWVPRGGPKKVMTLGRVEKAVQQSVLIRVRGDGVVTATVNGEATEHNVGKGGLKLRGAVMVSIGYAGEGRVAAGLAIRENFLPFRGTIQHFSISTGSSFADLAEGEIKRFGRRVHLVAPGPAATGEKPAAPKPPAQPASAEKGPEEAGGKAKPAVEKPKQAPAPKE